MENEFKTNYPNINMDLKENDMEKYDLCIIQLYLGELCFGYIVDDICEVSNTGLIVSYTKYNRDTIKDYIVKVNKLIDNFNEKYNKTLKHAEITFK